MLRYTGIKRRLSLGFWMNPVAEPIWIDTRTIERLPRWITHLQDETSETVALLSGAALMMPDIAVRDPGGTLPSALLRDRLALKVAVACLSSKGEVKQRRISAMRCVWCGQCDCRQGMPRNRQAIC